MTNLEANTILDGGDVGVPRCDGCGAPVKPDIVFFGEQLPERLGRLVPADFDACDLLLVMGPSLTGQRGA